MKLDIFVIGNQEKDFLRKRRLVMKKSKADLVMLLNSDISVSNYKNTLKLFRDPKLFAVTFSPHNRHKKVRKVDQACGGSSIYNRKIWNKIGGIDLMFEPYWFDDSDYSKRAYEKGYYILEDGNLKVRQVSRMGTDILKWSILGQAIFWRNFFLYNKRHGIPIAKRFLLIPLFWPFIVWANLRYKKFHG